MPSRGSIGQRTEIVADRTSEDEPIVQFSVNPPCAYCGDTPSFAVTMTVDGHSEDVYLCAHCDDEEMAAIDSD
jgi:alpha-D-ribose 1-methylphosphonate 5-phosphate C-P lyase